MLTVENAKSALRAAGMRITPQRLMIIDVLVGNRSHPSVEAIYRRVADSYPTISLATVYHTLSLLARHGLILELHGDKEGLRCDPETTPHAHAYCKQCGEVFDLPTPAPVTWSADCLPGFIAEETELSLYGRCARCTKNIH